MLAEYLWCKDRENYNFAACEASKEKKAEAEASGREARRQTSCTFWDQSKQIKQAIQNLGIL